MEKSTFKHRWLLPLLSFTLLGSTVNSRAAITVLFEQFNDSTVRGSINGSLTPSSIDNVTPFGAGFTGLENNLTIFGIEGNNVDELIVLPNDGVNDGAGFEFASGLAIDSIGPIEGMGTSFGSSFIVEIMENEFSGGVVGNLLVSTGAFDQESGIVSFDSTVDFFIINGTLSELGLDSFNHDVIVMAESGEETIDLIIFNTVPEPSSAILVGLGSVALLARRCR